MSYCIDCKHSYIGAQLGTPAQLLCRRYPPRLHLMPTNKGPQLFALFPAIDKDQTCGEFTPDTDARLTKEEKPAEVIRS